MKKILFVLISVCLSGLIFSNADAKVANNKIVIDKKMLTEMKQGYYKYKNLPLFSSKEEVNKKLGTPTKSQRIQLKGKNYLKDTYKLKDNNTISFYYYYYEKDLNRDELLLTNLELKFGKTTVTKKQIESMIGNKGHKNSVEGDSSLIYNSRTSVSYSKYKNNYYVRNIFYHMDSSQNKLEEQ